MRYNTFSVSHSKEGFKLNLSDRSTFRDAVLRLADKLCKATGHRGCNTWFDKVYNWADFAERRNGQFEIDREEADLAAWVQGIEGAWSYLDPWDDTFD